ncbi:MAG: YidH family protein [Myxococcaceae bacterium]
MAAAQPETLRLHQANERTMLAWLRTGIALMAFGFAIARFGLFLRELTPRNSVVALETHGYGSAWLGALLVALGTAANLFATIRYGRIRQSIERGDVGAPGTTLVYLMGLGTALFGLAMTLLLGRGLG